MKQMEFTKPHSHPLRQWRGTPKNSIIVFFSVMKKVVPEEKQARGKEEPKPDNRVLWGVWSAAAIASCKQGPGFSHTCKYPTGC